MHKTGVVYLSCLIAIHVFSMQDNPNKGIDFFSNFFPNKDEKECNAFLQHILGKLKKNEKYKIRVVKNLTQQVVDDTIKNSWNEHEDYKVMMYEFDKNGAPGFILLQKMPTADFSFLHYLDNVS